MAATRMQKLKRAASKSIGGWLLMLPALVLFLYFVYIPMFSNLKLSFYDVKGFTAQSFAGLSHYKLVFQDMWFKSALKNTLSYTFWSIIIGFILPIILGLFISELVHLKSFFKVSIYLPNIIPGIATVLIWSLLFSPEKWGTMNGFLQFLGLKTSLWFDNDKLVKPLIIMTMTWKGAGGTALIYLASFQNVDGALYEAAELDGATIFDRIIHISLPHVFGMVKMLFIMQIISVFQILYEPMVLGGESRVETVSLMQLVYRYAFVETNRSSDAAALGTIITIVLMILSGIYSKLTNSEDA